MLDLRQSHLLLLTIFFKTYNCINNQINGRKHQRKLGFSMRVERSTKDQMLGRLSQLAKEKERANKKDETSMMAETNYQEIVKAKDDTNALKKEERAKKRKEKKLKKQNQRHGAVVEKQPVETNEEECEGGEDDDEPTAEGIDPAMAAMMGFSSFGTGK